MMIKVGNQQLETQDGMAVFHIKDILPIKGYSYQFGIRDKILEKVKELSCRLKIVIDSQQQNFIAAPEEWKRLGEKREQIGFFKDQPMTFYWFKVDKEGTIK